MSKTAYKNLTDIINKLKKLYGSIKHNGKPDLMDILIATKLSQNTTDKTAYTAFTNLKKKYPDWEKAADAPAAEIKKEIKVCGLAETKTRQIKTMLAQMKKSYGGLSLKFIKKMNDEEIYDEFLKYKGLGIKTVSCLLAFGLGRNVFPVDTHVHRILNRLGIVKTSTPEQTFLKAKVIIPEKEKTNFHTNLIMHGRNICKAVNPLCGECILFENCSFRDKKKYNNRSSKKIRENNFIILNNV